MAPDKAVADGIKSTAGVITSAAAVMVVTLGAFAIGDTQDITQLSVGLAVAILIGAMIVRAAFRGDEAPRQPQLVSPQKGPALAAQVSSTSRRPVAPVAAY